jgi:hypothetical protein
MKTAELLSRRHDRHGNEVRDGQTAEQSSRRSSRVRTSLVAAFVWLACALAFAAQCQAQVCPLHVAGACGTIKQEVDGLITERNDLQAELKKASPDEKGAIANQIKVLLPKIAAKQKELSICNSTHGKTNLSATFNGTATLTTSNPKVAGPFAQSVSMGITYQEWLHDQFTVDSFQPVTVGPFDTPIGSNTTTVSLINPGTCAGTAEPSTGKITVTLKLHFHHSLKLAADSDLFITLSTENPGGSRLKSGGAITLVGDGTFQGGYLGGDNCHLVVKGTLLPLP